VSSSVSSEETKSPNEFYIHSKKVVLPTLLSPRIEILSLNMYSSISILLKRVFKINIKLFFLNNLKTCLNYYFRIFQNIFGEGLGGYFLYFKLKIKKGKNGDLEDNYRISFDFTG